MENGLVVKHNDLIQARYNLSLNEQRIILYSISKLDRDKKDFEVIRVKISELIDLLDTTEKRYTEFKLIAENLISKTLIIKKENSELITSWLSSMEYLENEGIIELEFSKKLIPYLLQLKERFTRYELKNILNLKNKHSIRIYELMKQYENIGKREFELEEFKNLLMLEGQYERIYDLDRFVLNVALDEINEFTDINIGFEKIKKGRRVVGLLFTIDSKEKDEKVYIEFLNESYNIQEMKAKMGLNDENFNSKQIMAIYEKAVEKAGNEDIDLFEYIRLNYLHIKDKARNKYGYLLKALENDYAVAVGQIKFNIRL